MSGGGGVHFARGVIQVLLAHRIGLRQRLDPLQVRLCGPQPGLLLCQRTFGRGELGLEGFGIHLEHDLARIDDAALGIKPRIEETVDAGPHLHLL